MQHLY